MSSAGAAVLVQRLGEVLETTLGRAIDESKDVRAALQARRTWLLRQKQLARTKAAYGALGGTEDEATAIKSELLTAITTDFLGADAASSAIAGVVKHKMKAVQELLDMGGELDEEEEAELKDTRTLEYAEVKAFGEGLKAFGPVAAVAEAESDEILR